MGAATVDIPAIVMNVGPMLNGELKGLYWVVLMLGYDGPKLVGSGNVVWQNRELLASGIIDQKQFTHNVALSAPSAGHCNTIGTATTMVRCPLVR